MIKLPREHGAWAMLLVPYAAGAIAGSREAGIGLFVQAAGVLAILMLFMSRPPLVLLFKRRTRGAGFGEGASALALTAAVPAFASLAILLWLGLERGLWQILPLSALGTMLFLIHLVMIGMRRERSAAAEFIGVAMLTLTAPLANLIAEGSLRPEAWWLWLLNATYFTASIFYVKMRMRAAALRDVKFGFRTRLALSRNLWLFIVPVAGVLLFLCARERVPPGALLAYLPYLTYLVLTTATMQARVHIRREGVAQSILAVVFAISLGAAYHLHS